MKKKHPDAKLTLREAHEKYYDETELSRNTKRLHRSVFTRWERFTSNPPIGKITNKRIHQFREACIAHGYAPATINTGWTHLRSTLRRLCQPETGNPRGCGIIDIHPWMKRIKTPWKIPRRVSLDDLSLAYISARVIAYPKYAGHPPVDYWRALLVMAFFTAMRKSDLFAITLADIDVSGRELHFTAEKTGKEMVIPLHDVAIEHIERIWSSNTSDYLFPRMGTNGNEFTENWRQMIQKAGVQHFTLHDIRRTSCSEIDRVQAGMGAVILQHIPMTVTGRYINKLPELRECVDQMSVPLSFKHGARQADRAETKARKWREAIMRDAEFRPPGRPDPSEWKFVPGTGKQPISQYWFRGQWRQIGETKWRVLKLLATAPGRVDHMQMTLAVHGHDPRPPGENHVPQLVSNTLYHLRVFLRIEFGLPNNWNPIPYSYKDAFQSNGSWSLLLPPDTSARATA